MPASAVYHRRYRILGIDATNNILQYILFSSSERVTRYRVKARPRAVAHKPSYIPTIAANDTMPLHKFPRRRFSLSPC